jgi:hypothetical protein
MKCNGIKAEIVFREELEYIKSPAIKSFTLKCFKELTPDYFWDFTASSSQKHHPKVSNKKHGIVLHTKLCVWWARKLADNFDVKDLDVVVSALLLHDLQKFGTVLNTYDGKPTLAEYWGTHGPVLAVQIEGLYQNVNINEDVKKSINTIIICIALHMGRFTNKSLGRAWSTYLNKHIGDEMYTHSQIVQLADYCASRQCDTKMKELDEYEFPYME